MKYDCSDYQCYTAHPKHEHQQNDQRNDHKTNNALLVVEANVSTYAHVKKSAIIVGRKIKCPFRSKANFYSCINSCSNIIQ